MSFKTKWLEDEKVRDWISVVTDDPTRVFCRFCGCTIRATHGSLLEHASTHKHNNMKTLIMHKVKKLKNYRGPNVAKIRKTMEKRKTELKDKKKPASVHKPPCGENTEPPARVQDISIQPQGPSVSWSPDRPREFSVGVAPRMPSEDSAVPPSDEPSIACGFLPMNTTNAPYNGPVSSNGTYSNSHHDNSDDLNYLFGLCVGAGLRKCSEEQASLARLKIQTVMHEASLNRLQL